MNAWLGRLGRQRAKRAVLAALAGLLLCAAPLSLPAQQNIIAQEPTITLQQAIEIAQRRNPGRVVGASTKTQGDRTIHEIRILGADNVVRTVRIDAQSAPR